MKALSTTPGFILSSLPTNGVPTRTRKTSSRHLQEGGKERRWHHSSLRVLKRVCRWRRFSGTRARRETRARRIIALTRSPRPSPRPRLTGQPSLFRHVCHAPTFVHALNRSETQRPRARGVLPPLHGAGHGRRGRGAHLEAAGHRPRDRRYGLQPGVRVVAPEMRSDDEMPSSHVVRFLFFFSASFALRSRRSLFGAARSSSRLLARRSARCFRTSTTCIAMTDARDLNPN